MMDTSVVQRVVDENILRLMREIGIPHWDLEIIYGPTGNDNWKAMTSYGGIDYQHATITINPADHSSEDDVLNTLIHELIHVLLSPLVRYRAVVTTHIMEGTPEDRAETLVWTHAIEQTVLSIERGLARSIRPPQDKGGVTDMDSVGDTIMADRQEERV